MKNPAKILPLAALFISIISCSTGKMTGKNLEEGFLTIPDSVQTSVYWYWISGNISEQGVVEDLRSMKQAGIDRAFIGNIGLPANEAPEGPVKLFSDEWWHITRTALRTASELGIEIGIFNCPGWSQAGGPWIEPQQSMRRLASTRTVVDGGGRVELELPVPKANAEVDFQDVKVIAFPGKEYVEAWISAEIILPADRPLTVDITSSEPLDLRSITVQVSPAPMTAQAEVQVKTDSGYKTVSSFAIDRSNTMPEVGFDTWAPVVVSVPNSTAREFRVIFSNATPDAGISRIVLSSEPRVERYAEKTFAKMFQTPLPYWHEYMWAPQPALDAPLLAIAENEVIDLTPFMNGNTLSWDAPEGRWTVMRTGMLPTGVKNDPAAVEGRGLEVDKMTSKYLQHHFDSFLGAIMERIPAEERKTFTTVVADSYEKGGQNFSDTFIDDFTAAYGYDPVPFLPVYEGFVVGSPDKSDRFLWDMRRLAADKLSYEHIGGLREIANRHGLSLWVENYGHWGFPGEFLQYGGQADEVAGEFWSEGSLGDLENRAASSCGHIYGMQKISSESFTCGGVHYSRHPADMKQRGDRFFAEGINSTLLHLYISQYADDVFPGTNAPFGNEFNRKNTWFTHLDLFTEYLKRTNYMLQQGLNVADVAYFIGEDTPKMTGITDPALPAGYQFDYINAEVLLRDAFVEDGMLTLPHGTRYRILVLPRQETMRPELLDKIAALVSNGAVVLGPAPSRSPSLEGWPSADERVRRTAASLWGEIPAGEKYARIGAGMIMEGMTMEEAFALIECVPDLVVTKGAPVLYAHREVAGMHIYFVTNQSGERVEFDAGFRTVGMTPELWLPVDGSTRALSEYSVSGAHTSVPLRLEPFESCFVVFRDKLAESNGDGGRNFTDATVVKEIDSPWTLRFDSSASKRGPAEAVVLENLSDLSTHADDAIKYYSGNIIYETSVIIETLPEGRLLLDLGDVGAMAKVYVDNRYAGGVWTLPYTVDVTGLLKKGENNIRIDVVGTWVNRLIGDSSLPVETRGTYTPNNPWAPDSPLQKSGLVGPVSVIAVQ